MNRFGFARVTVASTRTSVADPGANLSEILDVLSQVPDSDVVAFPELGVTGYTCADLFGQETLLMAGRSATLRIAERTRGSRQLVVVGLPVALDTGLYNCAVAIADGMILGIVPKQYLPNSREFYEGRWFRPANGREPLAIEFGGRSIPFGIDLLFRAGGGLVVGIEICEDLWMPIPPSSWQAIAGANLLVNLSASNETIGKATYRTQLVVGQSGRCISAYAYSGAGPSESTTDLVFGGHCLIAENGRLLAESSRVGGGLPFDRGTTFLTRDVDIERLRSDRRIATRFDDLGTPPRSFRSIEFAVEAEMPGLLREVSGTPFVPGDGDELHARCAEIFEIQCAGLAKRIERLAPEAKLNIGISGGLDSTLALLVLVKSCELLGVGRGRIAGLTMPGFGTTQKTLKNALDLAGHLRVACETIDIGQLALDAFRELGHRPFGIDPRDLDLASFRDAIRRIPAEARQDLTFENVQARLRTFLLMSRGFVVGTGDLSELALGWCTYNADHMSMYNPNGSIPKTLVKFLVEHVARSDFPEGAVRETLMSIARTTISPELLPTTESGEIEQSTEATLGPYELHDFFLYHAIRGGSGPAKIRFLAQHAGFTRPYSSEDVRATMATFYRRFFSQQFKRSCLPDGPKVGTVSLSPRGDWRMPSDAEATAWLAEAPD